MTAPAHTIMLWPLISFCLVIFVPFFLLLLLFFLSCCSFVKCALLIYCFPITFRSFFLLPERSTYFDNYFGYFNIRVSFLLSLLLLCKAFGIISILYHKWIYFSLRYRQISKNFHLVCSNDIFRFLKTAMRYHLVYQIIFILIFNNLL